jgi:hypothetical protein
MSLVGAVYKWRLDNNTYVYLTDEKGKQIPYINFDGEICDKEKENKIKDIVVSWSETEYCDNFTDMVNYVHTYVNEKNIRPWKDLRFLDCSVYLQECSDCEAWLKPSFPTDITIETSSKKVRYYDQPKVEVKEGVCEHMDGQKIKRFDFNFKIPAGIPGLTIKPEGIIPDKDYVFPEEGDLNDGYFVLKDADPKQKPYNSLRGDLYVCTKRAYYDDSGNTVPAEYECVGNLIGPPLMVHAKAGTNINKTGTPTVTLEKNASETEYTFVFDYLRGKDADESKMMLKDGSNYVGDLALTTQTLTPSWAIKDDKGVTKSTSTNANIDVEFGAVVDYLGKWKYNSPSSSQKKPTTFSGDFANSDVGANVEVSKAWNSINKDSSKKSFSQKISAPKSGLIVSSNKVVRASGNDENTVSNSVSFKHRIFYGLSTNANISDLSGFKSLISIKIGSITTNTQLVSSLSSYTTSVDCTGGRYIYFIYPSSLGSLTWTIGGFDSTALIEETTKTITNDYGYSVSYKICRTPKQTGNPMNVVISKK